MHAAIFGCFLLWRAEVLGEDAVRDDRGEDEELDEIDPDDDTRLHQAFAAAVAAVALRADRMSL